MEILSKCSQNNGTDLLHNNLNTFREQLLYFHKTIVKSLFWVENN